MKCIKCGMEIADNSKFCGYCGNPVQPQQNLNQPSVNQVNVEQPKVEPVPVVAEPQVQPEVVIEQPQATPVQPQINTQQEPSPLVFETPNGTSSINTTVSETPKKKSNTLVYVLGAIAIIVVVALILVLTVFNGNNNASASKSIDALEKAISNMEKKSGGENSSATVKASIVVEGEDNQSINLSGNIKYQKISDQLKLQINIDKSMFMNEMNLYANIDSEKVSLYTKSDLIDMIAGTTAEDNEVSWLSYTVDLKDLDLNLDEIKIDNSVDLSSLEKNFKYIGKEGNLDHYTLTIDKELLKSIENEVSSEEYKEMVESLNQLNGTLVVDLYINSKEELEKVSMDLSSSLKDSGISKAVVTIEFKDLNNTIVNIPEEALNGIDFEKYIEENMPIIDDVDMSDAELNF